MDRLLLDRNRSSRLFPHIFGADLAVSTKTRSEHYYRSSRVDSETLEWFRSKGEESEQHMAAALKIYAAAQKTAAGMSKSI